MERLGVWLRRARDAKGVSLQDAADVTRIRLRFLDMLEAGSFSGFPGGEMQARGFLRIYARYLSLSPDDALARYDAEVYGVTYVLPASDVVRQEQPARQPGASPPTSSSGQEPAGKPASHAPSPAAPPAPVVAPARRRPRGPLEMIWVGGVVMAAICVLAFVAWMFLGRDSDGRAAPPSTVAPSPTSEAETLSALVSAGQSVTPTLGLTTQGAVSVSLEATEHVWVRVVRDGETVFEDMMARGQLATWRGQDMVTVEAGDGAALLVSVNGDVVGELCGRYEACERGWAPFGEVALP